MGPRQWPDLMQELIRQLFPQLRDDTFEITSPRDLRYNCIAWAAGDTTRWWWPGELPFSFWPRGVRREESIASFVEAFTTLGYEITRSGELEQDHERVALFASNDGVPTHMARQLTDGRWTSKLGKLEDIVHVDVAGVAGSDYGQIVLFLRRPKSLSD